MFFGGADGRHGGDVPDEMAVAGLDYGLVQTAEHAGCVVSEYVLIDVCLAGDGDAEVGQKPLLGQSTDGSDQPGVAHVGGYEGNGCPAEKLFAVAHGRVAGDLLDCFRAIPAASAACCQRVRWSLARALAG